MRKTEERQRLRKLGPISGIVGLFAGSSAYAGHVIQVSEPSSLVLLGLGGAVLAVVAIRNRWKM